MKVTILGGGAYGTALAIVFNKNKCDVTIWEKFVDKAQELEKTREIKALPNILLPKEVKITSNLKESIKGTDIIVIAIPAGFVDEVAKALKDIVTKKQHLVVASKGIEQDSCLFIVDVINKYINTKNIAVISGPSFAIDLAKFEPIGMTLATKSKVTGKIVYKALANDTLKLRLSTDIIGTEICGAIKNIIAIASGMISGMGLADGTSAMLITESLNDIKALIKGLGGNGNTILTFAGFGDLLMTCTSTKSRNFKLGYMYGSKVAKKEINDYINSTTIEGLYTLKSIHKLIRNKEIDMPIIDLMYEIVFNNLPCEKLKEFLINKE